MPAVIDAQKNGQTSAKGILNAGLLAAKDVATMIDPYVPTRAKNAAEFALHRATGIVDTTSATAAQLYEKSGAASVVGQAAATAEAIKMEAFKATNSIQQTVATRIEDTVTLASRTAVVASDTVLAYTPPSAVKLVQNALSSVDAVRVDGLTGLKEYVPAFVIAGSNQTYEIFENVSHNLEAAKTGTINKISQTTSETIHKIQATGETAFNTMGGMNAVNAIQNTAAKVKSSSQKRIEQITSQYATTTGFIVSKINGVVQYVIAIPNVQVLLNKLKVLTGHGTLIGRALDFSGISSILRISGVSAFIQNILTSETTENTKISKSFSEKDLDSGVVVMNGINPDIETTDSDASEDGIQMNKATSSARKV
ncbi:hypothetical protein HK100_001309 [Physocladia obscura]|uniref:Uncharacterized protein n=1 Tax=Physocladia obscura TaxID=109957 RepID=A0AAD5SZX7_9FUNG|nr:hypothetical protein HK100_001309 [Physocladia obscura]